MIILAPGSSEEFKIMMAYAVSADRPVLLRYPKAECPSGVSGTDLPLSEGRGVFLKRSVGKVLLITLGGLISETISAWGILKEQGFDTDLYNLRFIKPIDEKYLLKLMSEYSHVFLVEEGSRKGGIGEYIASILSDSKLDVMFEHSGIPEEFLSQALRSELLTYCGLDGPGIAGSVGKFIGADTFKQKKFIPLHMA